MLKYFNEKGYLKDEFEEATVNSSSFTYNDLDCLICDIIEGGCNYWATVDNTTDNFKELKETKLSLSEKISELIFSNKEVLIECDMPEKVYTFTLDKLLKGIKLNEENRPWDCDLENGDAITADCILQYALFDDVVFG